MIRLVTILALLSGISNTPSFAAPGASFSEPVSKIEFVFVKGGCYQMGNDHGGDTLDERPVHEVCLSDFYLGKYEVTQKQWQTVMGSNPAKFKECGLFCPVEQVSWLDVQEFLKRLNLRSGRTFRLPTEAEWEYAARNGGKKESFSGGNSIDPYGWYQGNSANVLHPAGQKQPNGLGFYDMTGNVWEWVQDWHHPEYYSSSPRNDPHGPDSGTCRVLRGGSISSEKSISKSDHRGLAAPDARQNLVGFRVAISAKQLSGQRK
jgi:sulfatase modifying factor 1